MRFVFDTNVIVSALLLANSIPRQAFDRAIDDGTILVSVPVILELADVLGRNKLNKYLLEEERMRFLVGLLKEAELVRVTETIDACRDPKDQQVPGIGSSSHASCIVSGDKDLLVLNPFCGVPIVTPNEFLTGSTWESVH